MFSTGIVLAFLRLYEPFFLYLVKEFCLNCFGILLEKDEDGMQSKTLSSFLASSLNVELVHIILKGIKKFQDIPIPEYVCTESEMKSMSYRQLEQKVDK